MKYLYLFFFTLLYTALFASAVDDMTLGVYCRAVVSLGVWVLHTCVHGPRILRAWFPGMCAEWDEQRFQRAWMRYDQNVLNGDR